MSPTSEVKSSNQFKASKLADSSLPMWKRYALLVIGQPRLWPLLHFELVTLLFGSLPGALGLFCRKLFYPALFRKVGKNVAFGRNITLRHPHKISIEDNVIIDDYAVLDAKGDESSALSLGRGTFIGRNTILYTKDGTISLHDQVCIGPNSQLYSNNQLVIGEGTNIAAYCYLMSGGRKEYLSALPQVQQSSYSNGPTIIGRNCWIGAKVIIQDGLTIGDNAVIGAGAVVTKDVPADSMAMGVPAKISALSHPQTQGEPCKEN